MLTAVMEPAQRSTSLHNGKGIFMIFRKCDLTAKEKKKADEIDKCLIIAVRKLKRKKRNEIKLLFFPPKLNRITLQSRALKSQFKEIKFHCRHVYCLHCTSKNRSNESRNYYFRICVRGKV